MLRVVDRNHYPSNTSINSKNFFQIHDVAAQLGATVSTSYA
jgi:hypothetical protein